MTEKIFKLAFKKSATLFFVAVFVVSTGFNLSMPFVAYGNENETTPEVVTTEVSDESVDTEDTQKQESEEPTDEPEVLGATNEESVQGGNGGGNSGAIWTTLGSCGDPQNINSYAVGETVYINYSGFDEGSYDWDITGKPGGASADPNISVASDQEVVDETGAGCFEAYVIASDDDGEYGVSMGNKKDNYNVDGQDPVEEEICNDGIDNDGDQLIDEDCPTECEIDPKKCEEDPKTSTVTAYKVLCEDETDLPDWGNNGASITSSTAQDYVDASEGKCELVNWTFEWFDADDVTPSGYDNQEHVEGWTTFASATPTEVPADQGRLWFSEQMPSGYIPFTADVTPEDEYNTVGAEFYCATDVLHYDNLEFIDVVEGESYTCVGFNVEEEREEAVCLEGVNLVDNGSFETPTPTANDGEWEVFNTIAGWLGGKVEIINGYDDGFGPWIADDLDQFATLDTCNCDLNSIYQNLLTIPGATYKVSFAHSADPGYGTDSNVIEFWWDENLEETYSDDGSGNTNTDWKTEEFEFIADSSSTEIRFTGKGIKDGRGNFLDDVRVECVPEDDEDECDEITNTYVSDTSTKVGDNDSVVVDPIHSEWTASIPGATWIWSENPIADAVNETEKTFTKTFTIIGTPEDGTLDIATDNSYEISINGNPFQSDATEDNHSSDTQDSYVIPASALVVGENTITFTITNWAQNNGTMSTNPAGLLYKLVVNSLDCGDDDGGDDGDDGDDGDNGDDGDDDNGGGGGGSSRRSGSSTTGEVLGESIADPEVLAATGTENISYLALSGLILFFLVATKRRNKTI